MENGSKKVTVLYRAVEEDGVTLGSWREFVKYPNLIPCMNPKIKNLFDTLQELIPIVWNRDRVGTFLHWREQALKLELITWSEYRSMGTEMIDGCGGM